ncbi:MAG: lysylphosphatidylglycerol synthase transmembrane domain-containing protein [Anaerolineales bacterium]
MQGAGRKWLVLGVSLAVSLGAIWLIFRDVDLAELGRQVEQADLRYIGLLMVLYPLAMVSRTVRFMRLLAEPVAFWRAFHIINIGYFFNATMPARLGEVARVVLVSREPGQTMGAGLSAASVDRLFDLIMALVCVGLGLVLLPQSEALPAQTRDTIGVLILAVLAAGVVVLFSPALHPLAMRLARLVVKPLPKRLAQVILTFASDTLDAMRAIAQPQRLLMVLGWTLTTWVVYVLYFYIGLYAFFEPPLALGLGFLITGFVAIGAAAPSLPGAVGVFQAAAVLALRTAGYATAPATGFAWLLWIFQIVVVIIAGVIGLSALSLRLGQLTKDIRQTSNEALH